MPPWSVRCRLAPGLAAGMLSLLPFWLYPMGYLLRDAMGSIYKEFENRPMVHRCCSEYKDTAALLRCSVHGSYRLASLRHAAQPRTGVLRGASLAAAIAIHVV